MDNNAECIDRYAYKNHYAVMNDYDKSIVFKPEFVANLEDSFMSECLSAFNEDERVFVLDFIAYEDGLVDNKYVTALDKQLSDAVKGITTVVTDCI